MRKSLSLLVMESEKEYKITLKSVVNVHDKEHLEKIKTALMGHQVRKVEADQIVPFTGKTPKDWPEAPIGLPIYTVSIVLGMEMSERDICELLSLYTGIQKENFIVLGDVTKELEEAIKDGTETDDVEAAQDQVGQKRLDKFMSELKAERSKREKTIKSMIPVTEGFVASALEVRSLIHEGMVGKGYWFVRNMGETRISVMGPYENIPVGTVFTEGVIRNMTVKPGRGNVVTVNHGSLTEYVVDLVDDTWKLNEDQPYDVRVKDTSTGKTYTAAVRARDSLSARNMGIEQVTSSEGIPRDNLLALNPTD